MQHSRRRDPYPFTWEIPVAGTATILLLLVLGVHVGRAVAVLLSGGGWAWAPGADLFSSLPGLLSGDASAGLGAEGGTSASTALLRPAIWATEMVLVVLIVWAIQTGMERWGPGRLKGMATRTQAEHLLGLSRLRKVKAIVRPDRYGNQQASRE